jgi:hypothetical protein
MAVAASSRGPLASTPYFANPSRNFADLIVTALPSIRTSLAPIRALSFATTSRVLNTGISIPRTMLAKR